MICQGNAVELLVPNHDVMMVVAQQIPDETGAGRFCEKHA